VVNSWPRSEITTRGKPGDTMREQPPFDRWPSVPVIQLQIKRLRTRVQPWLVEPDITLGQAPRNSGSTQTRWPWHHLRSKFKISSSTQTRCSRRNLSIHRRARFSLDIGSFWKTPLAQLGGKILETFRSDLNWVDWIDLISNQQILSPTNISIYSQQIRQLQPTNQVVTSNISCCCDYG